jgi:hypothetical protein
LRAADTGPGVAEERFPLRVVSAVTSLAAWIPDADTRRKILVDNPSHLYGF